MQPVQHARYRTCDGASSKGKYEGRRCSSDVSVTSQKYYSSLEVSHKFISVKISAEVFEGSPSLQDRKKKRYLKIKRKIDLFCLFLVLILF